MPELSKLTAESATASSYRWAMLALMAGLYMTFGVVSSSLAPLVTLVSSELQLSPSEIGAVLGAWQLVYVGVALWAGLVIDRFGLRPTLAFGTCVMALSAAMRATAGNFETLFASVALMGLGGPMISVGTPKLVSVWFASRERGGAIGVTNAASPFGAAIALAGAHSILLPMLGNWRWIFLTYAVFAAILTTLWLFAAREVKTAPSALPRERNPFRTLSRLARVRNVQLVLLGVVALFAINHGVMSWTPTILEIKGFTRSDAGYWAAVVSLLSSAGLLAVPRFVPPERRIPALVVIFALFGASTAGMGLFTGELLVASLIGNGLVRTLPMALWFLVLMETPEVGPANMGAAGGLFFAIAEIGGFGGPWLFGVLFEQTGAVVAGSVALGAMAFALIPISMFLHHEAPVNTTSMPSSAEEQLPGASR